MAVFEHKYAIKHVGVSSDGGLLAIGDAYGKIKVKFIASRDRLE